MFHSLVQRILAAAAKWAWNNLTVGQYAGIKIVERHASGVFLTRTVEALELLKRTDPRRFGRVQNHLKYIVRDELAFAAACYDYRRQACRVDFARLHFDKHPKVAPMFYAGLLVHEATHGVLRKRGIPYNEHNRERIERLCRREDYRFKRHFNRKLADKHMERFPEEFYQRSWSTSWWQRTLALWKRKNQLKGMPNKSRACVNTPAGRGW
jgi:hypothetical protein